MKPGDRILTEWGDSGRIVEFGPRDKLDPLPGIKLIGNAVIYQSDVSGKLMLVYEWEVELSE